MSENRGIGHREVVPVGAASGGEAQLFHDIVRKHSALPPGVRRIDFHFGEDSEGDPAVWISFVAQDDLKPSREKIADIRRVMDAVRAEILRSDTDRWPYVEIVTE